jgi:hypothetical protein
MWELPEADHHWKPPTMLHRWPNALTQDVFGGVVCLLTIAAIGLVVGWGSESKAQSHSSLMVSSLKFGRRVASHLNFVGTRVRALGSHWRKVANATWHAGQARAWGADQMTQTWRRPSARSSGPWRPSVDAPPRLAEKVPHAPRQRRLALRRHQRLC